MGIKEKLDSLRARAKAQIKPESTKEEIDAYNEIIKEIDDIEKEHNEVLSVNAKYKDALVNMVLKEGNSETPKDEEEGKAPQSMEEFLADFKAKNEEKK